MSKALARWQAGLEGWTVPEEILAAAAESPWGFPTAVFARQAEDAVARAEDTPSDACARAALPDGGTVLDVGCGAGAGGLRLAAGAPRADLVIGVDSGPGMLEAFAAGAQTAGVAHREVAGRWPDVAPDCPAADVVVCHHVLYNVADPVPFARALTAHARHRVVVELTGVHPLVWMGPIWEGIHGLARPRGPSAADLVEALADAGIAARLETWRRPFTLAHGTEEAVAFLRRRLCVGPERDPDVARLLALHPPPDDREVATLTWHGAASARDLPADMS